MGKDSESLPRAGVYRIGADKGGRCVFPYGAVPGCADGGWGKVDDVAQLVEYS